LMEINRPSPVIETGMNVVYICCSTGFRDRSFVSWPYPGYIFSFHFSPFALVQFGHKVSLMSLLSFV